MQLTRVGFDEVTSRHLFLMELNDLAALPALSELPSRYFACLLGWDARMANDAAITNLARQLLAAGGVYLCTWGPDCERVHDLIDLQYIERVARRDPLVLTTWHADESLADALWFFLNTTWPDDAYFEECRSAIALVIGNAERAKEIREALTDPRAFRARVLSAEPDSGN